MPTEKVWAVIGRGYGTWHAYATDGGARDFNEKNHLDSIAQYGVEGALVYDASEVEYGAFANFLVHGPGFYPLSAGTLRAASGKLKPFNPRNKTLSKEQSLCGYHASADVYEAFLRQVPNIKIGHVRDGVVVWE